ncbi:glycosyltransferase family 4 protein [Flagellimonas pacifica]|uniref:Glycosyltransferase involved in cell wall bisynthesis n=1 Tax=Flagellimonas pacifica TaxID=1247520 RepID=A0A285MCW8_9FLAO|nr:glycosyltransferase family 4 protein [Allomuricauda parva]SNY95032.1 Glycosyltransferase involved in cell wall bisynthesis [Allomuricauda parva]
MKILYLSYYFRPDITAAAFRSSDFVDFLDEEKIEHRIITTLPHKTNETVGSEKEEAYRIKRIELRKLNNGKFVTYVLHYISFIPNALKIALKWRLKRWRPSIVFISSPPIFIGFIGLLLKWMFQCKLVLEVRDIWPESAVAAGQINPKGRAYKIARVFEKKLYKWSDGIVCVGKYMKDYLEGYTNKEICIAYNGPKRISIEEEFSETYNGSGLPKKIKLAYAGNFGLVQGLDILIEAFSKFVKDGAQHQWELHFFGTGVLEESLRVQANKLEMEGHIMFRGIFPKDKLNEILRKKDVLFLGLIKGDALEKTIPSKLFDYLAFGKPILARLLGEGKEILSLSQANIIVEDFTENEIFNGLLKMEREYSNRAIEGKENKAILQQGFTREENNAKILSYLNKVESSNA